MLNFAILFNSLVVNIFVHVCVIPRTSPMSNRNVNNYYNIVSGFNTSCSFIRKILALPCKQSHSFFCTEEGRKADSRL